MTRLTSYSQLESVAALFRDFPHPWFVSGGWAIDLFRGEVTRKHEDLEIGVFRSHQHALRFLLQPDWSLEKVVITADGPAFVPWYEGEYLVLPIHQGRALRAQHDPDEFEIFLNDADGEQWWFRRDAEIRRPAGSMALRTPEGIPYLRPEIQLLYKARLMRDKDRHDFEGALPLLTEEQRRWLKIALTEFIAGHEWLDRL